MPQTKVVSALKGLTSRLLIYAKFHSATMGEPPKRQQGIQGGLGPKLLWGSSHLFNPLMLTAEKTSLTILMKSCRLKHNW